MRGVARGRRVASAQTVTADEGGIAAVFVMCARPGMRIGGRLGGADAEPIGADRAFGTRRGVARRAGVGAPERGAALARWTLEVAATNAARRRRHEPAADAVAVVTAARVAVVVLRRAPRDRQARRHRKGNEAGSKRGQETCLSHGLISPRGGVRVGLFHDPCHRQSAVISLYSRAFVNARSQREPRRCAHRSALRC